MTYQEAKAFVSKARNKATGRPWGRSTRVIDRGSYIAVKYHATEVVKIFPDGTYTLHTGGWKTKTTKARINEVVGYQAGIFAKKGVWFVGGDWQNPTSEFYEGIRVNAAGDVIGEKLVNTDTDAEIRKFNRIVSNYVKNYMAYIYEHGLPYLNQNRSGDCWACLFQADEKNNPGIMERDPYQGREPMGLSHYLDHFKDKYYVPSLLDKAIDEVGWRHPDFIRGMIAHDIESGRPSFHMQHALRRFFQKRKPELFKQWKEQQAYEREEAAV